MVNFKRFGATGLIGALVLVCAGCQPGTSLGSQLQAAQTNIQNSLNQLDGGTTGASDNTTGPAPAADTGPSITQTALYHLFTDHPYDTTRPFSGQYPRVALTVLTLSSQPSLLWQAYAMNHTSPPEQCFTLSATIWYSATSSSDVPAFEQCFPRDGVPFTNVPLRGMGDWAEQTGFWLSMEPTTGNIRTAGPIPPDHPFPRGPEYQELYKNADVDAMTSFGAMMATVFLDMGFDWSVAQDRRVWVEAIEPISSQ